MREILFRGKRVYNAEQVEGLPWKKKYNDGNRIFISCFPDKDDNNEVYVVCPETVGQYTGLTDKNGKKIFEGDIVNIIYTNDIIDNCLVVYGDYEIGNDDWGLKFCTCGFVLKYKDDSGFTGLTKESTLEVIGNIHDNPELLGE